MEENFESKKLKTDTFISTNCFVEGKRLDSDFFDVPCIDLAKNLLGAILVRKLENNLILKAKIVETECYPGKEDKASHSFNGKRTLRNEPMFMKPGTVYVYKMYGMYHCLNISSRGDGAAVLLRSAEPIIGLERMNYNRLTYHQKRKNGNVIDLLQASMVKKNLQQHELCNGPSKLCISFEIISENCNKEDLSNSNQIWIEKGPNEVSETDIVSSTRIGIDSAGPEWISKLFRFYISNNRSVSVRDKNKETTKVFRN